MSVVLKNNYSRYVNLFKESFEKILKYYENNPIGISFRDKKI